MSPLACILEHMFDLVTHLKAMRQEPAMRPTPESAALLDKAREAHRAEARGAAQRLVAVGELYKLRLGDLGPREGWALDTYDAVAAQVAAALNCSIAMGASYVQYAIAMRDRLPEVGKVFAAGDIDYRAFQTIVFRTDLITGPEALAKVDTAVAAIVTRRGSLSRARLTAAVDRVVTNVDPDAVRRAKKVIDERHFDVVTDESGMAWLEGRVFNTAGRALDGRLNELAATVCDADPRTRAQRRADALGALAAGADRLACGCGSDGCVAGPAPRSNVVIHVVAEQGTVEGASTTPGVLAGVDELVPAAVVAELAKSARLAPVGAPATAPEPRYTPSAKLSDFVRCRDLTCRAPGCDRPAVQCDIDHTVAYAAGGLTHASNLKCLCRKHHLLKTFWCWRDRQLPDGTVIWETPDGHAYVTTPGSALLFPGLCVSTPDLPMPRQDAAPRCGDRAAMMPLRTKTRAQNRSHRIATERAHNREVRRAAKAQQAASSGSDLDEPPPF